MSIEGTANTEYASLSGKIRTFVVDKTLTISGACADAKATSDAIAAAVMGNVEFTGIKQDIQAVEVIAQNAQTSANNAQATADSKAITKTYEATISTNWTASGDYFYQDITVSGIQANDNPVVDIKSGSDNAANVLYGEAISRVIRIVTSANSIRVWAKEKTVTACPIQLKVVR